MHELQFLQSTTAIAASFLRAVLLINGGCFLNQLKSKELSSVVPNLAQCLSCFPYRDADRQTPAKNADKEREHTMKTTMKNNTQKGRISMILTLGAAVMLGAFGCTDETDEAAAVSTQRDALSETGDDGHVRGDYRSAVRHARRDGDRKARGHRGKGKRTTDAGQMLLTTALRQDSLTAEQRQAVEKLVTAKKAERKPNRDESRSAFHSTLAQAVRSGKLDTEAVKAHFEKKAAEREARRAAHTEAINTLHSTLTPEQRAAVVADIKARFEKKNDSFEGRKHRNGNKRGFEKGKPRRHGRHGKGAFGMFEGLNFTEAQQQQLAALRTNRKGRFSDKAARNTDRAAARQEMKQCRTDYLESFADEKFDAAARCSKRSNEDRSAKIPQRLEGFQKMLTILTDEQRSQLAERIEQAPARHRKAPLM